MPTWAMVLLYVVVTCIAAYATDLENNRAIKQAKAKGERLTMKVGDRVLQFVQIFVPPFNFLWALSEGLPIILDQEVELVSQSDISKEKDRLERIAKRAKERLEREDRIKKAKERLAENKKKIEEENQSCT